MSFSHLDHFGLRNSASIHHAPQMQSLIVPSSIHFVVEILYAVLHVRMLVTSVSHLFFHSENERWLCNSQVFAMVLLVLQEL